MIKYFKLIINGGPCLFIFLFILIFPLLFSAFYPSYNVFELFKAAYLWPGLAILLFLTLVKIIFSDFKFIDFKNSYLWLPFVLLLLLLVFNVFVIADDQWSAIFGSYDRRQGLITQLAYLLWFCLLVYNLSLVKDFKKVIKYLLGAMSWSGLLVAGYGFCQYLGFDIRAWQEAVMANRVIASLGQPNFLASFLLLSLGASFSFLVLSKAFYWRLLAAIAIFFQLLVVFLSGSRAAYLGLCLAGLVAVFIYFKKRRSRFLILASALVACLFIFIFIPNLLMASRLGQVFDFSRGSVAVRLQVYSVASQAILERPIFGYGLEQAGEKLLSYYQPDWALFSQVNQYPDRAHNLFLDLLLNFGLSGLIVYALLAFSLFYLYFFNKKEKKQPAWFLFLCLGLLAYFISLLFNFSSLATAIYAWSLLAILFAYSLKNKQVADNNQFKVGLRKTKLIKLVLIICLLVNGFLIQGLIINAQKTKQADRLFFQGRLSLANHSLLGLNYCWLALDQAKDPAQKSFYQNFIFSYLVDNYYLFPTELREDFYTYIQTSYDNLRANNYQSALVKAQVACFLAEEDWLKQINQVIEHSPQRPAVYQAKANCYFNLQLFSKAIENYQQALSLLPDINDSRLNEQHLQALKYYRYLLFFSLGQSYFSLADHQLAIDYYQQAYNSWPSDFNVWRQIAQANYLLGNLEEAIDNYLFILEKVGFNNDDLLIIAAWYEELGDKDRSNFYNQLAE